MSPARGRRLHIGLAAMNHPRPGGGGGLDIYTRQIVEALADLDNQHDYTVLVSENNLPDWSWRSWPAHVRVYGLRRFEPRQNLGVRAYRRWRRARGLPVPPHYGEPYLIRQIAELGLDLLHFPDTLIEPLGITVPCVLTVFDIQHEYLPELFSRASLASRAERYRPSVEKAVHVLAPSAFTRQSLIDKYGLPPAKVTLLPAAIDPLARPATAADVERVRVRYRLEGPFFCYPANPWPHKNHARLMAALRLYRDQFGPPPLLVLTGRLAPETHSGAEFALAAGVEAWVRDLGFVPQADLAGLFGGAEFMIFPSLFEGFGLPILEAFAYACPVAAAAVTSLPEIAGDAALYFDPYQPSEIAEAIQRLHTEPGLRRELVERGRQRLAPYAWACLVPQLIHQYEQIAAQLP